MRVPEDEPYEINDSRILEEIEEVNNIDVSKKDRYVGGIDEVTGLRQGQGSYKYSNPYFKYEGEWVNGYKHGNGTLKFADGGYYEGEFIDSQITGYGIRVWPNGSEYKGQWKNGEKHGEGTFENHTTGEKYEGDWVMNVRHGGGKWVKPNKEIIDGEFVNNQPEGQVSMRRANGDLYKGNVVRGVIHGKGEYRYLIRKMCYEGEFVQGLREGSGKYYAISGGYVYTGEFKDDQPTIMPNQMIYYVEPKGEEPADPKKKDQKKGEPEEDDNPNKLVYEVGVTGPMRIELRHVFQGEPYEDDTPLDEEEQKKQAAAKKGKATDEPEVRMVTPDPIIITQESGRKIQFELGRMEIPIKEVEGEEQPPVEEQNQDPVWVSYKFQQDNEELKSSFLSKEGVVIVEDIKYSLQDNFKAGKYEIIARDVTEYISNHLNEIRISLEIINPEEPPVPVKGKKK